MARFNFKIEIGSALYSADLNNPVDISIPLRHGDKNPNAWHAKPPNFTPVKMGDFVGSRKKGSPVNFFDVAINPHGNGTHTECVGHIAPEQYPVHEALGNNFLIACVASIKPQYVQQDRIITTEQIQALTLGNTNALVIRTLPNSNGKKQKKYSNTNPPFIQKEAMDWIVQQGIDHLLIDTPSVDKEEDGGQLAAHKSFWNYPANPRMKTTITEMVFVPDEIQDGLYLLNIQIPPMMLDAAPSRPFLFCLQRINA